MYTPESQLQYEKLSDLVSKIDDMQETLLNFIGQEVLEEMNTFDGNAYKYNRILRESLYSKMNNYQDNKYKKSL